MASACGGFGLLCWTGIRCGELLALTPSDFMLEGSRLRINESYQSLRGVDTVTDPKTPKSVRTIVTPAFLRDEMADLIEMRDDVAPDERLFAVTKRFLAHEAVDITYRYAHLFPTKHPFGRVGGNRNGCRIQHCEHFRNGAQLMPRIGSFHYQNSLG